MFILHVFMQELTAKILHLRTVNNYLKQFETKEAKDEERRRFHELTMKRVAAYIALMMEQWQDMDSIYAPYHVQ